MIPNFPLLLIEICAVIGVFFLHISWTEEKSQSTKEEDYSWVAMFVCLLCLFGTFLLIL